jgi:cell division protein FtsB
MSRLGTVLLGIYLSALSFTLLTFVYGEKGFYQYKELGLYRQRLAENVAELETYHTNLKNGARRLTDSREAVALAARELGYYREGEERIILSGGTGLAKGKETYKVASFIKPFRPERGKSDIVRLLSIIPGLIVIAIGFTEKKGDRVR